MDNIILPDNFQTSRPRKRWFKKPLFYIFILLLVVVGYYSYQFGIIYKTISVENGSWWSGVASIFNFGKEPQKTPDPNPLPSPEPDRLDVLILGIRGEDETAIEEEGGLLTDTILVASIDKINKKAAVVSIPRDLYIEINADTANGKSTQIRGKINQVYEWGLGNGGGLALAKQVISKITSVYIDNAIVFDFEAFRKIVDNLGGIDIKLAKPFEEKNQWGYEFYLPAGDNHLDGEKALYYVRSRYSTSDFDRARRQQEMIAAIKDKASAQGFLSNPIKITSLLSELKDDIRTDFQIWDIGNLLSLANAFGSGDVTKNYVITTENLVYETKTEKGEYILLPKPGSRSSDGGEAAKDNSELSLPGKEANFAGIKSLFKNILTN